MKKLCLFVLVIIFILALAACSDNKPGDPVNTDRPPNGNSGNNTPDIPGTPDSGISNPPPSAAFYFTFRNVAIEMDQDITDIIANIGEPLDIFEAQSCAFDGIDRIFRYPGIQIYTYPSGGGDHIHTIGFFDDSISTSEGGIHLGSSLQSVLNAYGNNYRHETGMYTFTRGLTFLEFLVDDNNIVIGITYRLDLGL